MENTKKISGTIITIGDELLIGQVTDTNSGYIASKLNNIGIEIKKRISVGDEKEPIKNAIETSLLETDIVVMTGGLGPTSDDITKPVLCDFFGGEMVVDELTLERIKALFKKNWPDRPLLERNLKQAEVPNNCIVLPNNYGTAPGMLFLKNGKAVVSLPGVPFEMKGILDDELLPWVSRNYPLQTNIHLTLLLAGVGESYIAEQLLNFEAKLPPYIKLAYLPSIGTLRLRLSAFSVDNDVLRHEIEGLFEELKELTQEFLVADRDISIQEVVTNLLKKHFKTLSVAESCTGGNISHLFTSIAGVSACYVGGIVCYDNNVKTELLKVNKSTLDSFGAVSEQTAKEMSENIRELMGTDFGLATTGIMGPTGETPGKPVGTVWLSVSSKNKTVTKALHLKSDRERNIHSSSIQAIQLLLNEIVNDIKL